MSEIIFEVPEDESEGGFIATALGFGIHTQAETVEELRERVKEAAEWHFDGAADGLRVIRLHSRVMKCSPSKAAARDVF